MTTIDHATFTAADAGGLVGRLRATFAGGRTRSLEWRDGQLARLDQMLVREESAFLDALHTDLGKPSLEGWIADIAIARAEIKALRKNLRKWTAPEKVRLGVAALPGTGRVVREPLGVALIIGPWNYPLQLVIVPLAGALAAGCAAVLKPSDLAPATAAVLARAVPKYLDTDAVAVVEGGVAETTALLEQRWDTIFYTGNGAVGRIVARAAAEHLTPVTLELGGKSPVIVDRDANLDVAAKRIAWGKLLNAGQTCVAPDHVLVHEAVHDQLVEGIARATRAMYGEDPARSPDYARIVNERHFDRVVRLIDDAGPSGRVATIASGGERVRENRYIAPTVLTDVADDAPVMDEEIFGPVLPVVAVADVDAAIARVNAGDKPLALYAFSESKTTLDHIVATTSSGGVALNHVVLQLASPSLPFGGVGESGYGAYHGRDNVDAFSHRRSVLRKPTKGDLPLLYPPFTRLKRTIIRRALTWF